ncbi:MAG: hypothetical protein NC238_13875 [Dehalobacter sp.]|nr:hypothetical protein [Dehalobacter sp.]
MTTAINPAADRRQAPYRERNRHPVAPCCFTEILPHIFSFRSMGTPVDFLRSATITRTVCGSRICRAFGVLERDGCPWDERRGGYR